MDNKASETTPNAQAKGQENAGGIFTGFIYSYSPLDPNAIISASGISISIKGTTRGTDSQNIVSGGTGEFGSKLLAPGKYIISFDDPTKKLVHSPFNISIGDQDVTENIFMHPAGAENQEGSGHAQHRLGTNKIFGIVQDRKRKGISGVEITISNSPGKVDLIKAAANLVRNKKEEKTQKNISITIKANSLGYFFFKQNFPNGSYVIKCVDPTGKFKFPSQFKKLQGKNLPPLLFIGYSEEDMDELKKKRQGEKPEDEEAKKLEEERIQKEANEEAEKNRNALSNYDVLKEAEKIAGEVNEELDTEEKEKANLKKGGTAPEGTSPETKPEAPKSSVAVAERPKTPTPPASTGLRQYPHPTSYPLIQTIVRNRNPQQKGQGQQQQGPQRQQQTRPQRRQAPSGPNEIQQAVQTLQQAVSIWRKPWIWVGLVIVIFIFIFFGADIGGGIPNPFNESDTPETTPGTQTPGGGTTNPYPPIPGLTLNLTGPESIDNGTLLTYTVGVSYDSSVAKTPIEEITIYNAIPTNTTFQETSGIYKYNESTKTLSFPLSEEGNRTSFTITLKPDIGNFFVTNFVYAQAAPPPSTGGGGGVCSEGSMFCSVENLKSYFGNDETIARKASIICQRESGSNPGALNDGCLTGDTADYSIGLFQINMLAHCPGAFASYSINPPACKIGNQQILDACVAKYSDPVENIRYVKSLSKDGTDWGPWSAATACNIQ